jgi:surface protein
MFAGCTAFDGTMFTLTSNADRIDSMMDGCTVFSDSNNAVQNWNVSNVTQMTFAFEGSLSFNSDVSGWNTGSATAMNNMFQNCTSFNQDISAWNIINVTGADLMIDNTAMSNANYSDYLVGWESQVTTNGNPININCSCPAQYEAYASSARTSLNITHGWSFTDGGPA